MASVLSGKAYAKALLCLKTVSEALERLLIKRFIEEENVEVTNPKALFNLVQTCSRETPNITLQDHPTFTVMDKYVVYEE